MTSVRKITMVKPASEMQSSINVTPLVDVVLVLLIIFMVVMPLLEKDFGVRIPTHEQVEVPTEVPPDQIIVDVDKDGAFRINGAAVARESYVPALQTRLGAATQRTVFVGAHDQAAYTRLIEAFEGARAAGAEILAMLPPEAPSEAPGRAEPPPSAATSQTPVPATLAASQPLTTANAKQEPELEPELETELETETGTDTETTAAAASDPKRP